MWPRITNDLTTNKSSIIIVHLLCVFKMCLAFEYDIIHVMIRDWAQNEGAVAALYLFS